MNGSFGLNAHVLLKPDASDEQIGLIASDLADNWIHWRDNEYSGISDLCYHKDFFGINSPPFRIIKMSKKEYVDDFFNNGKLQLGSFNYYRKFDNPEIGDKSEGSIIVVGKNSKHVSVTAIATGYNNYMFCCYDGEPNPEIVKRFGYDACFEIIDLKGFMNAISNIIGARIAHGSRCLYRRNKVLVTEVPDDHDFMSLDRKTFDIAQHAKFFLKTSEFNHQAEFRFIWPVENDIESNRIITCSAAIEFCVRL